MLRRTFVQWAVVAVTLPMSLLRKEKKSAQPLCTSQTPDRDEERGPVATWEDEWDPDDLPDGYYGKFWDTFDSKVTAFLLRLQKSLGEDGFACSEPISMGDGDDFSWWLHVPVAPRYPNYDVPEEANGYIEPDEHDVDIRVDMCFATSIGERGPGGKEGVQFSLMVTEYGGCIIGGRAPYNYTDQCFVDADDAAAVQKRWDLLSQCGESLEALCCLLREHRCNVHGSSS
jgi:hypothetical protein